MAYLIQAAKGIHVERLGHAEFDTFVVNMADLFEGYLRTVVTENLHKVVPGGSVRDGNKSPARLFRNGDDFVVKPDIYVLANGSVTLILDAKYKLDIKAADRYEILAFCEALQVKQAVLVYPSVGTSPRSELLGVTQSGVRLFVVQMNIGALDLPAEESAFITRLTAALARH
jgi:5-methylcytosine-specific restriction endonuclease McrBC regulatory subunit McrC